MAVLPLASQEAQPSCRGSSVLPLATMGAEPFRHGSAVMAPAAMKTKLFRGGLAVLPIGTIGGRALPPRNVRTAPCRYGAETSRRGSAVLPLAAIGAKPSSPPWGLSPPAAARPCCPSAKLGPEPSRRGSAVLHLNAMGAKPSRRAAPQDDEDKALPWRLGRAAPEPFQCGSAVLVMEPSRRCSAVPRRLSLAAPLRHGDGATLVTARPCCPLPPSGVEPSRGDMEVLPLAAF